MPTAARETRGAKPGANPSDELHLRSDSKLAELGFGGERGNRSPRPPGRVTRNFVNEKRKAFFPIKLKSLYPQKPCLSELKKLLDHSTSSPRSTTSLSSPFQDGRVRILAEVAENIRNDGIKAGVFSCRNSARDRRATGKNDAEKGRSRAPKLKQETRTSADPREALEANRDPNAPPSLAVVSVMYGALYGNFQPR
ncbi:hypothetical protein KM043_003544 [Ampulex compressa]|nr:hypothetical protein KM043_003544 [Ampulex compressa]